MLQNIKTKLLILCSALFLALFVAAPMTVSATHGGGHIIGGVCKGADELKFETTNINTDTCTVQGSEQDPNRLIRRIINIITLIVGVVAVIMIIFGGFRYIISGGSAEKVTAAKNTILYGIVGLIIVALAQVIVRFVLRETTSA